MNKNDKNKISFRMLISIFLSSASIIFLQSALTRIFSATSDYHATFFVISVLMLALARASILVFRDTADNILSEEKIASQLSYAALGTILAYIVFAKGVLGYFVDDLSKLLFIFSAALFYLPFLHAGYAIAGIITLQSNRMSIFYWADLLGASLACVALVPLFNSISAPHIIALCSVLFLFSGYAINGTKNINISYRKQNVVNILILLILNLFIFYPQISSLPYPQNLFTQDLEWEKWNYQSRIAVFSNGKNSNNSYVTMGWGISKAVEDQPPEFKWLNIDSGAGTQIIGLAEVGLESRSLSFIDYDISEFIYLLKNQNIGSVFIIGGGGGRDIISAKRAGATVVDVAEINPQIYQATNEVFSAFSGKPYSLPGVTYFNGEGRNILSKQEKTYDIIQMSMIDTFAASLAGSFALTENALYTKEAFTSYLSKLNTEGILTLSRWWTGGARGETGRAALLIKDALINIGVTQPLNHLVLLYGESELAYPATTFLVKKTPFTSEEIQNISLRAKEKNFSILWPANAAESKGIHEVLSDGFDSGEETLYDLSIPTDDRPFFFNSKRMFLSWYHAYILKDISIISQSSLVFVLTALFFTWSSLSLIWKPSCKIIKKLVNPNPSLYRLTISYFSIIGIGFMLFEIAFLNTFSIFLEHPHRSLSIVLFSMLFFSALGSFSTNYLSKKNHQKILPYLSIFLCSYGIFLSLFLHGYLAENHSIEILNKAFISISLIFPAAFCMGMFMPIGILRLNLTSNTNIVPLAWSINGLASILGIMLGTFISLYYGFKILLICGSLTYGIFFFLPKLLINYFKQTSRHERYN